MSHNESLREKNLQPSEVSHSPHTVGTLDVYDFLYASEEGLRAKAKEVAATLSPRFRQEYVRQVLETRATFEPLRRELFHLYSMLLVNILTAAIFVSELTLPPERLVFGETTYDFVRWLLLIPASGILFALASRNDMQKQVAAVLSNLQNLEAAMHDADTLD